LPAAYMLLKQQRQHEETRSLFFGTCLLDHNEL